jgi:hypothetical protein
LIFASSGAFGQPAGVTSAYTKLDLDRCAALDKGDEPGWMEWQCGGYGELALFVQNGDDRYDIDAGMADEDARWAATFDYPGETVEWRLRDGKPFAIIYRLRNANPDRPASSRLIVESVAEEARPGCRIAEIDSSNPDANVLAREAADSLLEDPAACLMGD